MGLSQLPCVKASAKYLQQVYSSSLALWVLLLKSRNREHYELSTLG